MIPDPAPLWGLSRPGLVLGSLGVAVVVGLMLLARWVALSRGWINP